MSQTILEQIEADYMKPDVPHLEVGETVDVHTRIVEGNKERIQVFRGVIISVKGRGINQMVTVRRIVANQGVERVFPVHSPKVAKIELVRKGDARRSKLYFLRDRVGKARRLRDKRRNLNVRASASRQLPDHVRRRIEQRQKEAEQQGAEES